VCVCVCVCFDRRSHHNLSRAPLTHASQRDFRDYGTNAYMLVYIRKSRLADDQRPLDADDVPQTLLQRYMRVLWVESRVLPIGCASLASRLVC
jgi:hypothetical protein